MIGSEQLKSKKVNHGRNAVTVFISSSVTGASLLLALFGSDVVDKVLVAVVLFL